MQKNNQLVYFLLLIMSMGFMGSCQAQTDRKSKSKEGQIKETRNVSSFNSLDLSISANVLLKQGTEESLILEGDAEDLEKVITEVSGSELNIKTRPGSWNIGKITVYLTMKDIKNLKISGSGSIKAETAIKAKDLDMVISGSGNINIADLSSERLSSVISGSGNINYSGSTSTNYSKIVVTGSGNINAEGLSSTDAQVNITGSGNCKVFATDKLDVQITGSGSVQYKGKALINANVTGSGKVRQI
ncbi:MAG TPA: head GIN domain-containing protein [Bacteroidales bacterium]|nr:head GIN domain-containing protein [Bacteroidales bacterium]